MAGIRNLQHGIQAIQQGNMGEGARLLRIALMDSALSGSMRATTLIWLAETDSDPSFKIQCYNDALAADPGNPPAQQRLDMLVSSTLPPLQAPPTPTITSTQAMATIPSQPVLQPAPQPMMPEPTIDPGRQTALFYRTVGILDGSNGAGTGFFVSVDGLIATTRYVVSGKENVTIALEANRQIMGKVVRSYPEYDLAFVQVELSISHILPFSNVNNLPDNLELTAIDLNGQMIRGRCRPTKRDIKPYWIPTTIRQLSDAGGNPVFDDRNYVVGMLTRNASRSSVDVFALHINIIRKQLEDYKRDMQLEPQRAYCPNCGFISRATHFGAFYCETCGSVLPFARSVHRFPIPQAGILYGENLQRACRHCRSKIGYYNGHCLRCGGDF